MHPPDRIRLLSPLAFAIRVLPLLGITSVICVIGINLGGVVSPITYFPLLIIELSLMIALIMFRREHRLNWLLLLGFAFFAGVLLSPLIEFSQRSVGDFGVALALVVTLVVFCGLMILSYRSSRDWTLLGIPVSLGFLALIVAWVLDFLFTFALLVQIMLSIIAIAVVLLFVLLITARIAHYATEGNPTPVAIDLFIGGVNLFAALLAISSLLAVLFAQR